MQYKRVFSFEEVLRTSNPKIDPRLKQKLNQPCAICNCMGHSEKFCEKPLIKITLPGHSEASTCEFYCSDNNWKIGLAMTYDKGQNQWFLEKNFKLGLWEFKFCLDNKQWVTSSQFKSKKTEENYMNNFIQIYPRNTEDYIILESFQKDNANFVKVRFIITEWSIKQMLKESGQNQLLDNVFVEICGEWDKWVNSYQMILKKNDEGIREWTKELIIEEKDMNYKFKLNDIWVLDPYRKLCEDGEFKNHVFEPANQQITNHSVSDTSCDIIDNFHVVLNERKITDMLVLDLWGHSMNLLDDQLYIIGGVGRNSFQNILYQIDLKTMQLMREHMDDRNAPEMLAFHKTLTFNEKLIIYGGQTEYQVSNRYHTFNSLTRQWTSFKIKNKIGLREHFSVCHKDNTFRLYFFGGYYFHPDDREEKQFNDIWQLNLKHMSFDEVETSNPPPARCHHTAVMFNWNMYIFGGCQIKNYQREVFNDLWMIDLSQEKMAWTEIKTEGPVPQKRFGHVAVKLQRYYVIHGGKSSSNDLKEFYLGDLWAYNTVKKIWTEIDYGKALVRSFHAACTYKNKILIFGGKCSNKIHQNQRNNNIIYELEF